MAIFGRLILKMDIISKKFKFIAVLFIAMISFILIYDRIGSNYRHIISKFVQKSPVLVVDNELGESMQQMSNFDANVRLFDTNKRLSSEDNHINRSANIENKLRDSKHDLYVSKLIDFESKQLIAMKKLRPDSKLLYPDQIKTITVMPIGDDECDANYGSALNVVIVVISRVNGFKRRQIIRDTWAQRIPESKGVKLYFAIGLTEDPDIEEQVLKENNKFNDLLQWNFIDDYYNLTIKSLGILRWFSLNCFRTKFLYKIDDDCILNVKNLVKFSSNATQNTIYGHLWSRAFVDRKKKSKFYISRTDYKPNFYPNYTGGPWLMSGALVPELYETAITKSLPALPYEDVYITGVVAQKANIQRKQLSGLIYFSKEMFKKVNNCLFEANVIFWQNLDDLLIENIWRNIEKSRDMTCIKTNGSTL